MATTNNMQLVLATVSETLGPLWAELINQALEKLDSHDHSANQGVKIKPSGLLINDELTFNSNVASNVLALNLSTQAAVDTSKTGTLQKVGTNLFWVNSAGTPVQITAGGSVNNPGSGALSVNIPSSYPYNITIGDAQTVLLVDTTAPRTMNLPSALDQMYVIIKDVDADSSNNPITINPDGTDTIDKLSQSFVIDSDLACVGLISDGVSNWTVI